MLLEQNIAYLKRKAKWLLQLSERQGLSFLILNFI